jgi:hypothetical protein
MVRKSTKYTVTTTPTWPNAKCCLSAATAKRDPP